MARRAELELFALRWGLPMNDIVWSDYEETEPGSTIRINDQWRICFRWREGDAYDVEIVDYH